MSTARKARRHRTPRPGSQANRFWIVLIGVVVVAGAVAVAVAARGSRGGAGTEIASRVRVVGEPLPAFRSGGDDAVGRPAPGLVGRSPTGDPVRIRPRAGTPMVLAFLAHWCPHCQAEVPRLVQVADQGLFAGVDVAAITTGTSRGRPNYPPSAWLRRERWPFPVLADTNRATAANAYGLSGYPFLVFVDAEGKVAGRASGELGGEAVARIVDALKRGEPITGPGGGPSSPARR